MGNTHAYPGVAGNFNPATTFSINDPAAGDPRGSASVREAVEPCVDAIEYLRLNALFGYWGDGSDVAGTLDGAATVAGMAPVINIYTATRDLFFTDLTINTGITLYLAGFRLYVSGTLTMAGTATIHCNGSNGSSAGTAGVGGGINGVLGAGAGSSGGAGGAVGAVGANVTNTQALGGAGGAGGAGNGGGAGGTSTATAPTAAEGSIRLPTSLWTGMLFGSAGAKALNGGAGGGGGGGAGAAQNGGGGAGAGGPVLIMARTINMANTILLAAIGGNGGNGLGAGGTASGPGGGGGGGVIIVAYHINSGTLPSGAMINVAGGAAGTGGNGGAVSGGSGRSFIVKI